MAQHIKKNVVCLLVFISFKSSFSSVLYIINNFLIETSLTRLVAYNNAFSLLRIFCTSVPSFHLIGPEVSYFTAYLHYKLSALLDISH